jgi:Protein of unknown function (DUF4019)
LNFTPPQTARVRSVEEGEIMKNKLLIIFFSGVVSTAYAADTINVENHGENKFSITLKSSNVLSIEDAQKAIYLSAAEACKPLFPKYEKYTFSADEPLSSDSIPLKTSFEFHQRITCAEQQEIDSKPEKIQVSESERKNIEAQAEKKTNEYFNALDSGNLKDAYAMLSVEMKASSYSEWSARQNEFKKSAGKKVNGGPWKVTAYINPPDAPIAGIYIAVDYEFNYEHTPFRCGYVVWLKQKESYVLIREDFGVLDEKVLKTLNETQIKEVKGKFRCGRS